jgi:hypothetical protein
MRGIELFLRHLQALLEQVYQLHVYFINSLSEAFEFLILAVIHYEPFTLPGRVE